MAASSHRVSELTRLGLTTYEAKAYVALLGRGTFAAAEVARHADLPRQRIYDVLASLVERGLATARPGRVVKYAAVPPDQAVGRLLEGQRRQLEGIERAASATIAELAPAFAAGREQTDPLDYIEVLRDARAISERFAELQASVQREILVFTKPPYATPPQENVEGLKLTRRHVARSVYETAILDAEPEVVEGIRRFIEAGEEARFVESLPLKLVIIDEAIAMFGLQDPVVTDGDSPGNDLTIMVVEHPSLALVLKGAFEATWERGITLEQAEALRAGCAAS
jgi:HTH-type transcriptional regulator, sugar sensing transcriptional regulator